MTAVYEYRTTRHRVAEVGATIRRSADVVPVLEAILSDRETEALVVLALNTRNAIIGSEIVATGSVSAVQVRVSELFRFAIRLNASAILLAHNHPSGDPTPSPDDLHLTAEATAGGKLLDVDVLDHVIIGDGRWYSMCDNGVAFPRAGVVR